MESPLAKRGDDRFSGSKVYRERAMRHLALGVSSTARGIQLPVPVAIHRAEGVHLIDVDGNRYIDYALGYGPLILGHSRPEIRRAVIDQLDRGLRTACTHVDEARLAELLAECVPSAEVTAYANSGTEAIGLALRIARAATGRNRVVKFRANYHGWLDGIFLGARMGHDGPGTVGQDPGAAASVELVDWGDIEGVRRVLTTDFAAVILEAAAVNAGCFRPPPGFLEGLREITGRLGVVLIFDEVLTGFRLALGGAQEMFGVVPDLSCLGKALGAGLPISAVSGKREVMEPLASGRLLFRGTFSGNPVSVAASIACLQILQAEGSELFPRMDRRAAELAVFANAEAARQGIPVCANQVGAALQLFAGDKSVTTVDDLPKVDVPLTLQLTSHMLRHGIHMVARGLMYLSSEHTQADIDETKDAIRSSFKQLAATMGD
jgi:glutamate-1-semialdehyde 2,1-aminomutase